MSSHPIPEDLRRFLLEHVESYEQLETLLAIVRSGGVACTPRQLQAALHLPLAGIDLALEHLCAHGLLTHTADSNESRYAYTGGEVELVQRLEELYRTQRWQVMQMMTSNAIERVRSAALRRFSNAFLLKKRPPDA